MHPPTESPCLFMGGVRSQLQDRPITALDVEMEANRLVFIRYLEDLREAKLYAQQG